MKDSQRVNKSVRLRGKYIKESNERFSTWSDRIGPSC